MSQGSSESADGRRTRHRVRRRVRVDESGRPTGRWRRWRSRLRKAAPVLLYAVLFVAGLVLIWFALGVLVRDPPMAADVEPITG